MNSLRHSISASGFLSLIVATTLAVRCLADGVPPEPGPENAGLRMGMVVTARPEAGKKGYDVRLELRNVSGHDLTLRANWPSDDSVGDLKDYIEAATCIETYPAIEPWIGSVAMAHRDSPQPELVLKAGGVLSLQWQTDGRQLKNKVSDPHEAQNPTFPVSGLYSVHATVLAVMPDRTVILRSNEALVPVGGSRELPRHTYGALLGADAERRTGTLGLGSLHKVAVGDQFLVGNPKGGQWRMTITRTEPEYSVGSLEPVLVGAGAREPRFPANGTTATLLVK